MQWKEHVGQMLARHTAVLLTYRGRLAAAIIADTLAHRSACSACDRGEIKEHRLVKCEVCYKVGNSDAAHKWKITRKCC